MVFDNCFLFDTVNSANYFLFENITLYGFANKNTIAKLGSDFFSLIKTIEIFIFLILLLQSHNGRLSMHRKKRVTKIVVVLTLTFMILWFPVHFLATWYRLDKNFPEHFSFYLLKMIAHTMSYANSSVNPIIYAFTNESFRHSITHLFARLFKRNDCNNLANGSIRIKRPKSVNEITGFLQIKIIKINLEEWQLKKLDRQKEQDAKQFRQSRNNFFFYRLNFLIKYF